MGKRGSGLLFELQNPGRTFLTRRLRERAIEFWSTRANPAPTGRVFEEHSIEFRDNHRIVRRPRLGEDSPIWIENHRVARANLVVVHAHAVAEDQKDSVV